MVTIIRHCDICGNQKNVQSLCLPVYRMHDGCDGLTQYKHPIILFQDIDICDNCLIKCTNIYDGRIMGYGNICISSNPELNYDKRGNNKSSKTGTVQQ